MPFVSQQPRHEMIAVSHVDMTGGNARSWQVHNTTALAIQVIRFSSLSVMNAVANVTLLVHTP